MKKQSVKKGIWYISGRRKSQRGGAFPLAGQAAPILGNLGGIVLKKIYGGKTRRPRRRRRYG